MGFIPWKFNISANKIVIYAIAISGWSALRRYSGNLASKSAVKAVISQELDTISRLAKENNWGKRKIQKEIRMLQSEVKKDLKKGVIKCH